MDVSAALPASTPLSVLTPAAAAPTAAAGRSPEQIKAVAQKFEASFLSVMMNSMFEGVSVSAPFGGGAGEEAFKSFLVDEMAKGVARRGGVGLSAAIQKEMMKMQGAS